VFGGAENEGSMHIAIVIAEVSVCKSESGFFNILNDTLDHLTILLVCRTGPDKGDGCTTNEENVLERAGNAEGNFVGNFEAE
jgi:hypothetical protein